jgi:DNA repair protein RadC
VECLDVLYLDSGLRLLNDGVERQETGTVDQVLLTPRKLAESALRRGAKSIVLAHNHPAATPASASPTSSSPSPRAAPSQPWASN